MALCSLLLILWPCCIAAANQDNDIIFIYAGDGTSNGLTVGGPINLQKGQRLIGEGEGLGITVDSENRPVLNDPVGMNVDGITVAGLNFRGVTTGVFNVNGRNGATIRNNGFNDVTDDVLALRNTNGTFEVTENVLNSTTATGSLVISESNTGALTLNVTGNRTNTTTNSRIIVGTTTLATAQLTVNIDSHTSSGLFESFFGGN